MSRRRSVIFLAIAFEAGLGILGWALAWWLEFPIASRLWLTADAAWRSILGLAPMLGLLYVAMRSRWPPLVRLREQVQTLARELFGGARAWQLAAVAAAAGAGEELLFRGALQPLAARWMGAAAGLIAVSVLFGAMHAASTLYFVLATAVGLYLGWLAQCYDDLVAPMFVHAAYDWAALRLLTRAQQPSLQMLMLFRRH
jgi:membrane protease YdiL (CAAX protease family)